MAALGIPTARVPVLLRAAVALPAALFAWFCSLVPHVSSGGSLYWEIGWIPQQGIALSFFVDGLSLLFALLITGIGTLIVLYASEYMLGQPQVLRFTAFLLAFMLSMLGLVLADNLIALFIFWELTALTSFLLIGYKHEDAAARRAALQALLVTGVGALAMLAGFVLLGEAAGTYSLRELLAGDASLAGASHYPWILALVLAGAFTKSAQYPLHFWLPNAMAAPTPVSAYLHSATMVKAGVFLLARMSPVLGGTEAWSVTLVGFGGVTAVYAALASVTRTDLKQVLAYTTVMALGTCVMFLGLPGEAAGTVHPAAVVAATAFILIHALYKAALFMVVGMIERATGSRDLARHGGLRHVLGPAFAGAALAGISMAGLPPFIGFVGKELLYSSAYESGFGGFALFAIFAASALVVTAALMVAVLPFFGEMKQSARDAHAVNWQLWIGPLLLGLLGLAAGVATGPVFDALVLPAAAAIAPLPEHFEPGLWHGFNALLLLSLATWAVGALVFWKRPAMLSWPAARLDRLPVTGDRVYDAAMDGIARFSGALTRRMQSGIQRRYILVVFATLALSVGATLVAKDAIHLPSRVPSVTFGEWALVAVIAASVLTVILTRSRLLAICALGVVGTSISLVFLLRGAPDVALTQLIVETLVVVIVAIVLLKLPDFRDEIRQPLSARWRDGAVAVAVGAATTLVLLAVTERPPQLELTEYFESMAVPGGRGHNIVNVILVDFRALDTLGEISVLVLAAAAVCALMRRRFRYRFDRVQRLQRGHAARPSRARASRGGA